MVVLHLPFSEQVQGCCSLPVCEERVSWQQSN